MTAIKIKSNERVFGTGKTGSGKSYLMRIALDNVTRLIVCDPKGTINENEWNLETWKGSSARRLKNGKPLRVRIAGGYDPDFYEPFFEMALNAGNVVVYIDEVYAIVPTGRISPALNQLITMGRERGIGVWAVAQRPVNVPVVFLTEADHFFIFTLQSEEDRKRVSSYTDPSTFKPIPRENPHGFYYMASRDRDAVYIEAI